MWWRSAGGPSDFCSGQGAVSIPDMPPEALDFFGSFINMDDPRHARQRGIVARSFGPRQLAGVLDSVETICNEVIDGFCEDGEADLVQVMSQPFPLLVICDMMGIPRSEFGTVLDATNVILGAGDPDFFGDRDPITALFESGMQLTMLMNELAEERRANPDRRSHLGARAQRPGRGDAGAERDRAVLHPAGGGRQRHDPHRDQPRHEPAARRTPISAAIWQDDLDGVTPTAVEEIVRVASPVTFMRRTATGDVSVGGRDFNEGDKLVHVLRRRQPRPARVRSTPSASTCDAIPNPHVGFGGPGPHFCLGAHLARREVSVAFRQLLTRLPDIEVVGDPVPLEAMGIPLVGGIKHLPVRFTPTAKVGTD